MTIFVRNLDIYCYLNNKFCARAKGFRDICELHLKRFTPFQPPSPDGPGFSTVFI